MDVRESLIKICDTDFGYVDEVPAEKFADYLLANDVTLVKHGKWSSGKGERGTPYAHCSACNQKMSFWCYGYAYCALCGARMDGDGNG